MKTRTSGWSCASERKMKQMERNQHVPRSFHCLIDFIVIHETVPIYLHAPTILYVSPSPLTSNNPHPQNLSSVHPLPSWTSPCTVPFLQFHHHHDHYAFCFVHADLTGLCGDKVRLDDFLLLLLLFLVPDEPVVRFRGVSHAMSWYCIHPRTVLFVTR